jgi:hypothetical protein
MERSGEEESKAAGKRPERSGETMRVPRSRRAGPPARHLVSFFFVRLVDKEDNNVVEDKYRRRRNIVSFLFFLKKTRRLVSKVHTPSGF